MKKANCTKANVSKSLPSYIKFPRWLFKNGWRPLTVRGYDYWNNEKIGTKTAKELYSIFKKRGNVC